MVLGSLLFGRLDAGQVDEARTLYTYVRTVLPEVLTLFTFASDIARGTGRLDDARRLVRAALVLDPENEELLRRARDLESGADGS
jgi:predicted Zn-dependent protease